MPKNRHTPDELAVSCRKCNAGVLKRCKDEWGFERQEPHAVRVADGIINKDAIDAS